ncbi:MAG: nucleotide sugar dehydrogenase, partial [Flavobacteriaceae bacterium]
PTATIIADKGLKVYGVDLNSGIINLLKNKKTHIVEPGLEELLNKGIDSGNFNCGVAPVVSSTYLIVVPTPSKKNNEPDVSYVYKAIDNLLLLLKKGDLCIIESTSPVGTTDSVYKYVIKNRPDLEDTIYFAYCPERVLPGNIVYELTNNDRVIGGVNKASTEKAVTFYEFFVNGELHKTNSQTAEMCKLVENASRDSQIAFANELSMICDKADINVWELIALANKHPRVNILNPGCGVGGHCIAVDPYFITSQYPLESKIINKAREVNNHKAFWCAEKIQNVILKFELDNGYKPSVGLFGLAFKPNIDDLRESPAKFIVQRVLQQTNNEKLYIVEPNLKSHPIFKLTDYKTAAKEVDVLVYLVAHKEFYSLELSKNQQVLDFCGITNIY